MNYRGFNWGGDLTERDELEKLYNDFVLKEPKITEEIEEIVKNQEVF